MVPIGAPPGGADASGANWVSGDGSVIVGFVANPFPTHIEAFRWTQATGMVGLGDLDGGAFASTAAAGSADGSVIVGRGTSASGEEAFRWTQATGMVGLGDLPGGVFRSSASDVSADGTVIVGTGVGGVGGADEAFLWTAEDGMRRLRDLLVDDLGLDLTGWSLRQANAISDDGLTIAGWGVNPDGEGEGWVATIPAPAGAAAFVGLAALTLRRRR